MTRENEKIITKNKEKEVAKEKDLVKAFIL
jgi:hypothetical protein